MVVASGGLSSTAAHQWRTREGARVCAPGGRVGRRLHLEVLAVGGSAGRALLGLLAVPLPCRCSRGAWRGAALGSVWRGAWQRDSWRRQTSGRRQYWARDVVLLTVLGGPRCCSGVQTATEPVPWSAAPDARGRALERRGAPSTGQGRV
jgi:hypothetical protein